MRVDAFARTYNRNRARMRVVLVQFEAPDGANLVELVALAHEHGAPAGLRTHAGVFELQTDHGVWSTPDETRLLRACNHAAAPDARFVGWDDLDAEAAS